MPSATAAGTTPRTSTKRACARAAARTCAGRARHAAMSKSARWFAAAAAIVLLDQLTKWLVLARFAPGERLELTSFFNMVLVFNKGAAFSFLAAAPGWQTPFFSLIALTASLIVGVLIFRNPEKPLFCVGL